MENKSLNWGERKARRLVGRAAEHGKPPVQIEFKTAADAKRAMLNLNLGGKPLIVKKYYDRTKTVTVPGAPTGPRVQVRGTPPWEDRRTSRGREGQDTARQARFYEGKRKESEDTPRRSGTNGNANQNRNKWLGQQTPQRRADVLRKGWRIDKSDEENHRAYERFTGCFIFPEDLRREREPNTNREGWTEVRRRQNFGEYNNRRATALHTHHG